MSPSVCSHVVLGKRHGPRLPPSAYRIPDYAPHSSLKCWKVLDHGPYGFPRVRDRDQNAFPRVLARPTYFRPSILAGFRSTALCFPIAGFRRPRSKVWKRGARGGQRAGAAGWGAKGFVPQGFCGRVWGIQSPENRGNSPLKIWAPPRWPNGMAQP